MLALAFYLAVPASARAESLTDNDIRVPTLAEVLRVLSFQDYNTRVVVFGVTVLGLAAGVLGVFVLLRKRALMGDAISHAALPGVAGAFLFAIALGGTGKNLAVLLAGAAFTGSLAVLAVLGITRVTRLKEDAALGIVLSVFFGAGIAMSVFVQKLNVGHAAGLDSFIYGRTAAMLARDAALIAAGALVVLTACLLLYKEFRLLCFDAEFGAAQGWPVLLLDVVLMGLIVAVTVIGLQAVGLILVIAMTVIPPAAARFWTHRLDRLVLISGLLGAISGLVGALASALIPRLPSGAVIVLVAGAVFLVSMLFGAARGWLPRSLAHHALARRIREQHLLRALYELGGSDAQAVETARVLRHRSWSAIQVRSAIRAAISDGMVVQEPMADGSDAALRLTRSGRAEARRVTRNHRLWELFLITYADIAPSHVDRDADMVEHVLDPAMVEELEQLLARDHPELSDLPSPHRLEPRGATAEATA